MPWLDETLAILGKELQTEWRTRVALSATALFAICSLTLVGIAFNVKGGAGAMEPPVAAAILWVLLLFTAATGLGRAYVVEEERGTALALRLTASGTAVWTGKMVANLLLLLGLTLLTTPAVLAMRQSGMPVNPSLLFCVLLLGDIGIAAVFTTTSALVAQATAKGGLLAALSFPILVPLLLAGVHGTLAALGVGTQGNQSVDFALGFGDLQVLISYAVVAVTISLMLIDFVWSD